jgi:hypothetical protein
LFRDWGFSISSAFRFCRWSEVHITLILTVAAAIFAIVVGRRGHRIGDQANTLTDHTIPDRLRICAEHAALLAGPDRDLHLPSAQWLPTGGLQSFSGETGVADFLRHS